MGLASDFSLLGGGRLMPSADPRELLHPEVIRGQLFRTDRSGAHRNREQGLQIVQPRVGQELAASPTHLDPKAEELAEQLQKLSHQSPRKKRLSTRPLLQQRGTEADSAMCND